MGHRCSGSRIPPAGHGSSHEATASEKQRLRDDLNELAYIPVITQIPLLGHILTAPGCILGLHRALSPKPGTN